MFVVVNSKPDKSLFAVKDTKDGVVEWYTVEQLNAISGMGIKIKGYYEQNTVIPVVVTRNGIGYAGITLEDAPTMTKLISETDASATFNQPFSRVYYVIFDKCDTDLGVSVDVYCSSKTVQLSDDTLLFAYKERYGNERKRIVYSLNNVIECRYLSRFYTIISVSFTERDVTFIITKELGKLYNFANYERKQSAKSDYVCRCTLEDVFEHSSLFWQVEVINDKTIKVDTPKGVFIFDKDDYVRVYGNCLTRESRVGQSRAKITGVESDIILENGTARQIVTKGLSWEVPSTVKHIDSKAFKLEKLSCDAYTSIDVDLFIPNTLRGCEEHCFDFSSIDKTYTLYVTVDTNSTDIKLLYRLLNDLSSASVHWAYPRICINGWSMYRVYLIYALLLVCISSEDMSILSRILYRTKTDKYKLFGDDISLGAQPVLGFLSGDELCFLFSAVYNNVLRSFDFAKNKDIDFNYKAISEAVNQGCKDSIAPSTYDGYFEFLGLTTWRRQRQGIWFLYEIVKKFNDSEFVYDDKYDDTHHKMQEALAFVYSSVEYLIRRLDNRFSDVFGRWSYGGQTILVSRLADVMMSRNRGYWKDTEDKELLSRLKEDAVGMSLTRLLYP